MTSWLVFHVRLFFSSPKVLGGDSISESGEGNSIPESGEGNSIPGSGEGNSIPGSGEGDSIPESIESDPSGDGGSDLEPGSILTFTSVLWFESEHSFWEGVSATIWRWCGGMTESDLDPTL